MAKGKKKKELQGEELHWVEAEGGYSLALRAGKLVCRNAKGKVLSAVPKKVKEGERAEELTALRDWLEEHEKACGEAVESWMLRSLPIPRSVLEAVWPDPSWRGPLENAVVMAQDGEGELDPEEGGFFRGVDREKGVGVVNLDGETEWLDAPVVAIPHPILIEDLNDYRELATELSLGQGVSQLFRETFPQPEEIRPKATAVGEYSNGRFKTLNNVLWRCRKLGYQIRGGFAVCPVWEGGRFLEGRYWIGSDDPDYETYTGDLYWVDEDEKTQPLKAVGPVAYSEGVRMASAIYAARSTEEEEQ